MTHPPPFRAALTAALLSLPAVAQNPGAGPVLQSGHHDRILVTVAPGPVTDTAAGSARLVSVCLRDLAGSDLAKAFGTRRDAAWRQTAPPGGQACAPVEPARQIFYFAKADPAGGFQVVLAYPMDLRRSAGGSVRFDWLRDRAD
ncbi:MAG: hypothetical protein KDA50_02475 [Rhodobacteraceae bacterium]|nr:hypothetical protein [Paracoccaceae bacterium]